MPNFSGSQRYSSRWNCQNLNNALPGNMNHNEFYVNPTNYTAPASASFDTYIYCYIGIFSER